MSRFEEFRVNSEEVFLQKINDLTTLEARRSLAVAEVRKDIKDDFLLMDPSRPYYFFRAQPLLEFQCPINMEEAKKRAVLTIDRSSPITWFMDNMSMEAYGKPGKDFQHISITYPFIFDKAEDCKPMNLLETIFLDYTARFRCLKDSPQLNLSESAQSIENAFFNWNAGNILKELIDGAWNPITRVVLKVSPKCVDTYGDSAGCMIREISEGLGYESPMQILNGDALYCIWQGQSLVWT